MIVYGLGAPGLAEQLGITKKKAQEYIDMYLERYSGVAEFIERSKMYAKAYGHVKTLIGRKRRLPHIHDNDQYMVSRAERQAVNARIQGSAGDYMNIAMIRLEESLRQFDAEMLIQVHDEILVRCPKGRSKEVLDHVNQVLENIFELRVPIVSEGGVAFRWGTAK